jgi:membrane protease YdiL (CAAX protease family)
MRDHQGRAEFSEMLHQRSLRLGLQPDELIMTIAAERIESPSPKLIAPWWHTALLITLFLGITVGGALFQGHAREAPGMSQQHPNAVPLYLSLIVLEWGLFLYVWRGGLRRTGTKLHELIGGRWASAKDVLVDFGLALAFWGICLLIDRAWGHWSGNGHAASIQTLLPQRALEIILWVGLSLSAGFCEELVFRGYFQKQFETFAHSRWIALFLQAVLFGISHGYQGIQACVKIALLGAMFGLLALWRRSLLPGMMAHAWMDIMSGIFGI